jgi:SAM-dependent methyltransferase
LTDWHQQQLELLLATGDHPTEIFRDVDDDFWLWAHTEGRRSSAALESLLPGLPGEVQQTRWTGKSGADTQVEGFAIYRTVRDLHRRHFGSIRDHGPVLDFGCGWGRVLRYFLKDAEKGDLIGVDHDQANIDFCLASNPWCRFERNEATPPLPIEPATLGLIYAYSVFSHFDEPMHRRWLEEFKRLLRPGGALMLTVRPRTFIEHARRLREQGAETVTARMFVDTDSELARYDAGQFCYAPYNGDGPTPWWGEACIPRPYVEDRWSELFDVVEFHSAGDLKQHVVVLRA